MSCGSTFRGSLVRRDFQGIKEVLELSWTGPIGYTDPADRR